MIPTTSKREFDKRRNDGGTARHLVRWAQGSHPETLPERRRRRHKPIVPDGLGLRSPLVCRDDEAKAPSWVLEATCRAIEDAPGMS